MVKSKNIIKKIKEFKRLLTQDYNINKIILFGSHAKKSTHKDSDIDVAVISNDFKKINRISLLAELLETAQKVDINIEPIAFTYDEYLKCDPRTFLAEIKRTGLKAA